MWISLNTFVNLKIGNVSGRITYCIYLWEFLQVLILVKKKKKDTQIHLLNDGPFRECAFSVAFTLSSYKSSPCCVPAVVLRVGHRAQGNWQSGNHRFITSY